MTIDFSQTAVPVTGDLTGMVSTDGDTTQVDGAVAGQTTDAAAIKEKAVEAMAHLTSVLGGSNISVSQTTDASGKTTVSVSVPEVDDADEALATQADLEALTAYLQMEMDEKLAETQGKRIEQQKAQLESAHDTQLSKINESVEKAREQEKAAKAQKALSIFSAILSVVAAVAITIVTGGVAAGFAIAGAVVAVGSCVANLTGGTKALCKLISSSLQENNPNMNKAEADAAAEGIVAGVELALSLICAVGGGFASAGAKAGQVASTTAKAVKTAIDAASKFSQVAGYATTAASTVISYQAGMAEADVTENQEYLAKIQQMLEESEDDLEQILDSLMSAGTELLELLESKTDTNNKITEQIGQQMA